MNTQPQTHTANGRDLEGGLLSITWESDGAERWDAQGPYVGWQIASRPSSTGYVGSDWVVSYGNGAKHVTYHLSWLPACKESTS